MKNLWILCTLFAFTAMAQTNKELLHKLAKEEAHGKVVKVFETPSKLTEISAEYSFKEMRLNPEDVLYFYVPEELSKNFLSQIGFSHRQIGHAPSRDYSPGLTSSLVYTKDIPGDELRYWGGHSSGELGAKFAEYRRAPEFDALYEWPRMGHKGIKSKKKITTGIHANVVRIQNVGTDEVYFSKLYVETLPSLAQNYQNIIFTPKSDFGDPTTLAGRYYGGGQNHRGKFPNALRIDSDGHRYQPPLPANMKLDKNRLFIKLPVGSKLSSVEIMCGDTHPDGVRNKDGGWGSLGSAKISVIVENEQTGEERILLEEKNVGPQGVISASDISSDLPFKDGDRLVIMNQRNRSTAYIMALKIGYNP